MKWSALDLQNERVWTLTPEDTKAKRQHLVPLTQPAVEVITSQTVLGEYVFTFSGDGPVGGFSKAKEDIDELSNGSIRAADAANDVSMPHWRLHDLRRTVATHMEDALGIPPHVVGAVLNHDPKSYKGITATYTRGSLLYERRRALTAWSRFLSLVLDAEVWGKVEKITRPETEADAAHTDEFRRMIFSDAEVWGNYLKALLSSQTGNNVRALRRGA
jgi:integrase